MFEDQDGGARCLSKVHDAATDAMRGVCVQVTNLCPQRRVIPFPFDKDARLVPVACNPPQECVPAAVEFVSASEEARSDHRAVHSLDRAGYRCIVDV
jgi:hypothetical protein